MVAPDINWPHLFEEMSSSREPPAVADLGGAGTQEPGSAA